MEEGGVEARRLAALSPRTWGDAAVVEAASAAVRVPACLRPATAVMCRHMVVPIEKCLADPEYVRRFVQYDAHTSAEQRAFRKAVRRQGSSVRVDLKAPGSGRGAGGGWVSASGKQLAAADTAQWIATFGSGLGVSGLRAEGLFETLTPMQARLTAALAFLFMQPGARFRVAVADGYLPDKKYRVRPHSCGLTCRAACGGRVCE